MITNIIVATVTAYCAGKCCCGPQAKGICANGNKPIQGITIAASRRIPFGSQVVLSIPGTTYGNLHAFTVQDRLAKRYDSRFDIFFAKHSDAKQFGIKTNQTVTIITK